MTRIFVPSKNRAATIVTHKLFPTATVVVHDKQQAAEYKKHQPGINVVVSGTAGDTYGLTRQREFVCKQLVKKDEWFVFIDDNVSRLICTEDPYYKQEEIGIEVPPPKDVAAVWRKRMNAACSAERFLKAVVPDTIRYCESVGAHLAGFATTDNIIARTRKFSSCAYVIGKIMVWHNTREIPFDHTISMEDFYNTGSHLERYGACVVNRYLAVSGSPHYQPGGMGTYAERVPVRKKDVQLLLKRFPGMFSEKVREGFEAGTDLRLRLTEKTLPAWRTQRTSRRLF